MYKSESAGGAVTGYGFDPKTCREFPCDKDGNEVAGGTDLWAIREDLAHIVQQLDAMMADRTNVAVSEAPDWPPQSSAVELPDGTRRCGSTGQLFESKNGQWVRAASTAVTEAEVEAAAKAIWGLSPILPTDPHGAYRIVARAALEAAAKVREGR